MTAQIIRTDRWRVKRTEPRVGDLVLGNATRPAMVVVEGGRMVERRRAEHGGGVVMDKSMIERVRNALKPMVNDGMDPPMLDAWLTDLARAAIAAMRDATFNMKMAGATAITVEMMKANANYDAADDCWHAMVDAALSETPEGER